MTDYSYSLFNQVASTLRRSPVGKIKRCLKLAEKHRIPITALELEAHYLAGGRIENLLEALVYAAQHNLNLSVQRAAVQDLARGREVSVVDWIAACHGRGVIDFAREPIS